MKIVVSYYQNVYFCTNYKIYFERINAMPNKNYIPGSEGELILWLNNFEKKLTEHKTLLNISAAEFDEIISNINDVRNAIHSAYKFKSLLKQKEVEKRLIKQNVLKLIRTKAARFKTESGYTDAVGEDMGIVTHSRKIDYDTYKPKLKAKVFPKYVEVSILKKGIDSVNLFYRLTGEAEWTFLSRVTKSKFKDNHPLKTHGVPEVRQYKAIGVVGDVQIGKESNIVSVVYGGDL
jgi:hypothetical protein